MQTNTMHPLHSHHRVLIAAPDRDRSIFLIALNRNFYRHEGRRSMMLRPIKLHPTGNPRTSKTNQRWLDHVLTIKKIIATEFVVTDMNASADFRQNHQSNKLIFDMDCLPLLRPRFRIDSVDNSHRVNPTTTALIDPLFEKQWIRVGICRQVREHHHRLFPGFHCARLSRRRVWQLQQLWKPLPQWDGAAANERTLLSCHISPG